jgi:hypothetical protein
LRRHRDISAAPRRSATGTWQAITDLIADTLDQSPHINRDEIESAMATAATVGLPLVAAGHLDQHPLTLVADPVHCAIRTISGTAALSFEENLKPIPGGGQANDFTLHLPTPNPLEDLVRATAERSPHLSADPPPELATHTQAGTQAGDGEVADRLVDLEALARRKAQRS